MAPGVPWYAIYLYFFQILAWTLIANALLSTRRSWEAVAFFLLSFILVGFSIAMKLQFTSTSMLLGAAASFYFVTMSPRSTSWMMPVSMGVLVGIVGLIRASSLNVNGGRCHFSEHSWIRADGHRFASPWALPAGWVRSGWLWAYGGFDLGSFSAANRVFGVAKWFVSHTFFSPAGRVGARVGRTGWCARPCGQGRRERPVFLFEARVRCRNVLLVVHSWAHP